MRAGPARVVPRAAGGLEERVLIVREAMRAGPEMQLALVAEIRRGIAPATRAAIVAELRQVTVAEMRRAMPAAIAAATPAATGAAIVPGTQPAIVAQPWRANAQARAITTLRAAPYL